MGRVLKLFIYIVIIICLIGLISKLGVLDMFLSNVDESEFANYSGYYFKTLENDEKQMYIRIDMGVNKNEKTVFLGMADNHDITDKATRVLTAYFNDHPKCYNVSNQYMIVVTNYIIFKQLSVKLSYITDDEKEIMVREQKLETAINKIIQDNITSEMTDFEKEIALHDALVNHTTYYKYTDINKIPDIKHTAYAALVEKEAVCDGYTKAFQLMLEKVGIESIIVNGMVENVAHAWNLVKLGGKYYHVDVTSDKVEDDSNKYVIHKYFNLTDEEIEETHKIQSLFELPKSTIDTYNYYTKNGYYISYEDDLYDKLRQIVSKQQSSNILEIKLDKRRKVRNVIDTLYNLNFGNWSSSGKASVTYSQIEDVYVFVK